MNTHRSYPNTTPVEADDSSLASIMDAYLRGDDLLEQPISLRPPLKLDVDDVSLMRAARQTATQIRRLETGEMPYRSRMLRADRALGGALAFVIERCSGRTLPPVLIEHLEMLGDFENLIVEFFLRRVDNESTLSLYERVQGYPWDEEIQTGLMECIERLWDVGEATGLACPELDRETLRPLLGTMGAYYMLAWFGGVDSAQIDTLSLGRAIEKLSDYTLKHLNRH